MAAMARARGETSDSVTRRGAGRSAGAAAAGAAAAGLTPARTALAGGAPPGGAAGGGAGGDLVVVDSHAHATPAWYEPVEALLYQMERHGVRYGHLVQIGGYFDNTYQEQALARHPGRLVHIVQVDWTRPDAVAQLEALVARGNVSGLRLRPEFPLARRGPPGHLAGCRPPAAGDHGQRQPGHLHLGGVAAGSWGPCRRCRW